MELLDLPPELIPRYALNLNLGQIFHLCLTSKQFNELICQNEHFWKMKFTHDYKFTPDYTGSWLKLYRSYDSLWAFGLNHNGQLGLGNQQARAAPTLIPRPESSKGSREPSGAQLPFKAVSAGGSHTLLIDLEDNVWALGDNRHGQLGLGDVQWRLTPTLVHQPESSKGSARLPFKAKTVSAGSGHTVLIDLENNVWSFGDNDDGQLGLGDEQNRPTPTLIPQLKAKAVSAGKYHTVLIDMRDNVWSFGWNHYGQLGLGDRVDRLTPTLIQQYVNSEVSREPSRDRLFLKAKAVSAGGDHTVLIDLENNVWSFGTNLYGQLGLGDQQRRYIPTQIPYLKAKAVSAGDSHTVLIDLENNVWSFGQNYYGQLGLGDHRDRLTPTLIPGVKAKAVSAGGAYTVLTDPEGNVWSFGWNHYGQLGLGDQQDRSTPTQIPQLKAKAVSAGGWYTVLIATLITS